MNSLVEMIKRHEGFRQFPYKCSAGKLTIGFGRNLADNGIGYDEALILLCNDIDSAISDFYGLFGPSTTVADLPQPVYKALVDMMFNLGLTRFKGFKKMIAAVEAENWNLAADEMLDSKWSTQVGQRAIELAEMMRSG